MTHNTQLYWAIGYCLFLLVLGWFFYAKQPKKINSLYGYRTLRSMASQASWKAANHYASLFTLRLFAYAMVLPFIGYGLYPNQNLFVTIMVHCGLLLSVIWFTERFLKARFDSQGNPK